MDGANIIQAQNHLTPNIWIIIFIKKEKLTIKDKTPNTNKGSWFRGSEILAYLKTHQDIEDYVILDDTFFDDFANKEIEEHLVLTDRDIGLTESDAKNAIKILLKE